MDTDVYRDIAKDFVQKMTTDSLFLS